MASTPGILTDWPWQPLGTFKYLLVTPSIVHSIYLAIVEKGEDRDLNYLYISLVMLWRIIHTQIWNTLSRYKNAKGKNLILNKSIEFEQVDRESNWDDQILLNGIIMYVGYWGLDSAKNFPMWRGDGAILMGLLHMGPVEFLYYWFHRALHHHFLFSRYHSHHHSSIVVQPVTSVIHPFAEHIVYYILFSMPLLTVILIGRSSTIAFAGYVTYLDFMNNLGHCNFEFIPQWLFTIFPPLKYLMYTPSFHTLHHTQFRTNYSLFMPFYDYIYGTMDKSLDTLHKTSLNKKEDVPSVVHLTHLTTPQSIYQLRLGFSSLASKPLTSNWFLWLIWPLTKALSTIITRFYDGTFIVDKDMFNNLMLQTWVIPRYKTYYDLQSKQGGLNKLIEEAILSADAKGVKVVSLGLLNQGEEMNKNGGMYLEKNPYLNVKVVDGSSLAVGVVLNSIPKAISQVVFRGKLSKVAYVIASALCKKGIKVVILRNDEYEDLKKVITEDCNNLAHATKGCNQKIWLVGEDLTEKEQLQAPKGTIFIPFSQFPPQTKRTDCFYMNTPALVAPKSFENLYSCENWLPRRVMSAWRVAGIVHGLEEWNTNECHDKLFDIVKVWEATLRHGFRPCYSADSYKVLT